MKVLGNSTFEAIGHLASIDHISDRPAEFSRSALPSSVLEKVRKDLESLGIRIERNRIGGREEWQPAPVAGWCFEATWDRVGVWGPSVLARDRDTDVSRRAGHEKIIEVANELIDARSPLAALQLLRNAFVEFWSDTDGARGPIVLALQRCYHVLGRAELGVNFMPIGGFPDWVDADVVTPGADIELTHPVPPAWLQDD